MFDRRYLSRALIWQKNIQNTLTCIHHFMIAITLFLAYTLSRRFGNCFMSLSIIESLIHHMFCTGIPAAACKVACLRTSTDPRYLSLSPLMGTEGSSSRTPYSSPFLTSSLAWIGGSLFASLKVKIPHEKDRKVFLLYLIESA